MTHCLGLPGTVSALALRVLCAWKQALYVTSPFGTLSQNFIGDPVPILLFFTP